MASEKGGASSANNLRSRKVESGNCQSSTEFRNALGQLTLDCASLPSNWGQVLEQMYPERPLLPPEGSPERQRAASHMRLERRLFSAWLGWLCQGW